MIKKGSRGGRVWIKDWMLPLLIALPILLFFGPLVNLGCDNLNMIKHFERDESDLIEFAGRTYANGLLPLEYLSGYPQVFYYSAGVFLFPYTMLKGIDHHLITVVLRGFNLLIVLAIVIFIYFFVLRFFKSRFVAFFSSLLLGTTPQILWWAINSRPHLLSIFFTLIAFYHCFKIVEKYQKRSFVLAVLFIGLATATNLFGIFIIPSLCLALFYNFTKQNTPDLLSDLKQKSRLIYALVFLVVFIGAIVPVSSLFIYLKCSRWFKLVGINSLGEFLKYRNFKILLILGALFIVLAGFWAVINYLTSASIKKYKLVSENRLILLFSKAAAYLTISIAGTCAVFLITNPTYFLFPVKNLKTTLFQFGMTTMGSGHNFVNQPLFDANALQWFFMLFDNNLLNYWFALLFAVYLLLEIANLRKNWKINRDFLIQRILMWVFAAFLFTVLFVFVFHRPHHYLLPMVAFLGILLAYGINEITKKNDKSILRWFAVGILGIVLLLGFYKRSNDLFKFYNLKKQCNNKTELGIVIGGWLREKFPQTTTIWKDSQDFYIPPEFKKVYFIPFDSDITKFFSEIQNLNPNLLVITNQLDNNLVNSVKIKDAINSGTLRGYRLIKVFVYAGPLALGKSSLGKYRQIDIYLK